MFINTSQYSKQAKELYKKTSKRIDGDVHV